ncbi:bifunctional phosphoribosylaminoimidazolecarboxamide formyltransferase/IMP cyclohydrolase [Kolteria novifilia]
MRRALLSVSDKSGLVELAQGLRRHQVELLSTGGTYRTLSEAGIEVKEISEHTGFPEILDGRVKTLHPKVHGGLLFRRESSAHVDAAREHDIDPIDLVVVNLYPFEQTVARKGVSFEAAIEQIDIGGPSMIRSAAKNHAHVAVLTDPSQYAEFLEELDRHGGKVPDKLLARLAHAAFLRTSRYDHAIEQYLAGHAGEAQEDLPLTMSMTYGQSATLRYGENPHQRAALYIDPDCLYATAVGAEQIHGKELSYNNLLDLDSALSIVREFRDPAAVVIKHNNPCGAAIADSLANAFAKAYEGDPVSAFGSIIGLNRPVDQATAEAMTEPDRFVEAIIAPSFEADAVDVLTTRPTWKKSVRLLQAGDLTANEDQRQKSMRLRPLEGGMLRQSADVGPSGFEQRKLVTETAPSDDQLKDLEFAWTMVKHVRSNAIVLVKDQALVGVGAGQMSRVDSVRIAIEKAGNRAVGSSLGSDAFFPFRDNIDLAAKAGIAAIVQPGGSKRDLDSIQACDEHGIAMLMTGVRHFLH